MHGREKGRESDHRSLNFLFTSNASINTYLISLTSPDERPNTTLATCLFKCAVPDPTDYTMSPFSFRHILLILMLILIL